MKIRILKGTTLGSKPVNPGEIYEVDEATYRLLATYQQAEPHNEPPVTPAPLSGLVAAKKKAK